MNCREGAAETADVGKNYRKLRFSSGEQGGRPEFLRQQFFQLAAIYVILYTEASALSAPKKEIEEKGLNRIYL